MLTLVDRIPYIIGRIISITTELPNTWEIITNMFCSIVKL